MSRGSRRTLPPRRGAAAATSTAADGGSASTATVPDPATLGVARPRFSNLTLSLGRLSQGQGRGRGEPAVSRAAAATSTAADAATNPAVVAAGSTFNLGRPGFGKGSLALRIALNRPVADRPQPPGRRRRRQRAQPLGPAEPGGSGGTCPVVG